MGHPEVDRPEVGRPEVGHPEVGHPEVPAVILGNADSHLSTLLQKSWEVLPRQAMNSLGRCP